MEKSVQNQFVVLYFLEEKSKDEMHFSEMLFHKNRKRDIALI